MIEQFLVWDPVCVRVCVMALHNLVSSCCFHVEGTGFYGCVWEEMSLSVWEPFPKMLDCVKPYLNVRIVVRNKSVDVWKKSRVQVHPVHKIGWCILHLAGFAVLITTDISLCTQAGLPNFIHQPSAGLCFFCDMLIKQTFKWQRSTLTAAFKVVNDIDLMDWLLVFLIFRGLWHSWWCNIGLSADAVTWFLNYLSARTVQLSTFSLPHFSQYPQDFTIAPYQDHCSSLYILRKINCFYFYANDMQYLCIIRSVCVI